MSTPTKYICPEVHAIVVDERDALQAENTRLREALEEAEPYFCEMPAVLENKLRALLAAGKGTSPDLSADPAAYDRIADRELGPAAGKGEK